MKTQQEIVEELKKIQEEKSDMFGFRTEVLLGCLDFEHAKQFLKPEATAAEWEKVCPLLTRDAVAESLRDYMEFAWEKALDHRGLSASRSVEKIETWIWILDDKEVVRAFEKAGYTNYGVPKLKAACEAYGFPIPDDERVERMASGKPCGADYPCGCGTD